MNREVHVRFCEGPRAKLPRPTHPELPDFAIFATCASGPRHLGAIYALSPAETNKGGWVQTSLSSKRNI